MSRRITHEMRTMRHLNDFGHITTYDAIYEYGNTRLAATIFNLRDKGHNIVTHQHEVVNRYGEKRIVAKYTLEDGESKA